MWDWLFGPPRVKQLEDGSLRVKLLGRAHHGNSLDELFTSVARERDRLITAHGRLREGTPLRPYHTLGRAGAGDMYHRDLQRLEDRLSVYNEFLGHLVHRLQQSA